MGNKIHEDHRELSHRHKNNAIISLSTILFNPLMGTLELQNIEPLYRNTDIGTLAVDGWAATFGTARRGLGGLRPRPVPSSLYQM